MPNILKTITAEMILASREIQEWLVQFPEDKKNIAINCLSHLRFVSTDTYSLWLKSELDKLPNEKYAVYAVRKFHPDVTSLWNADGTVLQRPAQTLGSEDLVCSILANIYKTKEEIFFDHPPIHIMKDKSIHNIILIDDSIGSGDRVSEFIKLMMSKKTLQSWDSLNLLHFHIVAFARTSQAEKVIIESLPGTEHRTHKYSKFSKVTFHSKLRYDIHALSTRWGNQHSSFEDLCSSIKAIKKWARQGFGRTMSNIVFYHSVPNNIPGIFWFENETWKPLFPQRSFGTWLQPLLERATKVTGNEYSPLMVQFLSLIKIGIRNSSSLAIRLNLDHAPLAELYEYAKRFGLITASNRISEAGRNYLIKNSTLSKKKIYDRSMYIPLKLNVGQQEVQPSKPNDENSMEWTEFVDNSLSADGEVGETSLERSDAKTASPSVSVMPHLPSKPRMDHDTHGHSGSKER